MWRQPPPRSAGARGRIECTYKIHVWAALRFAWVVGPCRSVEFRAGFGVPLPSSFIPLSGPAAHTAALAFRLSVDGKASPSQFDLPPFCSPHLSPSGSCWGVIGHEALVGLIGWLPRSSFRPVNAQPLIGYGHSMARGPGRQNIYATLTSSDRPPVPKLSKNTHTEQAADPVVFCLIIDNGACPCLDLDGGGGSR